MLCLFYFGDASAPDCVTSNILVPPSSRTFFPAEVIADPWVPFAIALLRFNPLNPNAPRLFDVSCPAAFKPPTAPLLAAPVAFVVVRVAVLTVLFGKLPAFAVAFVTPPTSSSRRRALLDRPLLRLARRKRPGFPSVRAPGSPWALLPPYS